jgi:hypothetical protein
VAIQLTARERYEASRMTRNEFDAMLNTGWHPREMGSSNRPAFLRNIPGGKLVAVFGSGSASTRNPVADGNPDHGQIGGIDVYRVAEATDGVAMNKDWHMVLPNPDDPNSLLVVGPKQDPEHWIDLLPERLRFALADPATVESVHGK